MHDVNQSTLVVQVQEIPKKARPRVYRTIARACSESFSLDQLFEQHDLVNGREVELHLGITE
jgi:hypothetical protein